MNVELLEAHLRYFLSHKDTKLSFNRGITVLIGPNGAGKTSIIEAIAFAFTGKGLNRREIKDLVNTNSQVANVKVIFRAFNNEYMIERKIIKDVRPRTEVKLYVKQNGKYVLQAMKKTEVERELKKILGVDGKVLRGIAFVAQGEVTEILESSPSERRELIAKISGITALSEAKERMRFVINYWKERRATVEGDIKALKAKIKEKEKLKEIIKKAKKEIEELNESLKRYEEELASVKSRLEVLDKNEKTWRTLYAKKKELEKEIHKIEEELNEMGEVNVEELEKKADELEKIIEKKDEIIAKIKELERKREIEEKLEKLEREIGLLKRNIERLSEVEGASRRYEELSKELSSLAPLLPYTRQARELLREGFEDPAVVILHLESLESELKSVEEKIEELNSQLGAINRKIKEDLDKLKVLKEGDKCPICGRPLTKEHIIKIRKELEDEIKHLRSELVNVKKKLEMLKERREELRKRIKKLEVLDNYAQALLEAEIDPKEVVKADLRAKEIREELKKLERLIEKERKIEELKRNLQANIRLRDELISELSKISVDERVEEEYLRIVNAERELKRIRKEIERGKEIRAKREKLLTMRERFLKELNDVDQILSTIDYNEEEHNELKKRYEELNRLVSEVRGKIEELKRKVNELEEEVKSIDDLKKQLKDKENELKKIIMFIKVLETVRSKLNAAQELTFERLRYLTERYMKEIIEAFSFDFYDVTLDKNFSVKVIGQRGEMEISQLSGGEKVAIGIALRLALAKALGERVGFIFLDEPTIHLDSERRRGLVDVFKNISYDMPMAQMILVTHDRELIDAADHVCEVSKNGTYSQVLCTSLTQELRD